MAKTGYVEVKCDHPLGKIEWDWSFNASDVSTDGSFYQEGTCICRTHVSRCFQWDGEIMTTINKSKYEMSAEYGSYGWNVKIMRKDWKPGDVALFDQNYPSLNANQRQEARKQAWTDFKKGQHDHNVWNRNY